MITVTHNATSLTPALVLGYMWERQANNIPHDIIGSASQAFTFRPASPRAGTLTYFCLSAEDAQQLAQLHADVGLFTVSDTDQPSAAMTYVPVGKISSALDPVTNTRWTVAVEYREVG